jgi:hypothetical protein
VPVSVALLFGLVTDHVVDDPLVHALPRQRGNEAVAQHIPAEAIT